VRELHKHTRWFDRWNVKRRLADDWRRLLRGRHGDEHDAEQQQGGCGGDGRLVSPPPYCPMAAHRREQFLAHRLAPSKTGIAQQDLFITHRIAPLSCA
jgi:hypothetical protein